MSYLIITLFSPIFGFTWVKFLLSPGEIFDFIPPFLLKTLHKNPCKPIPDWKAKILKLLYECEKCVAGQFAFLVGLAYPIYTDNYNWICHFISVITSIFIAGVLAKSWQTWEK